MNKKLSRSLLLAISIFAGARNLGAQGTAFTYQGQLLNNGAAATGSYDLTLALFNASATGTQAGNTLTNFSVGVTNGLFNVTADFGAVFNGTAYWLQLGVRTNGGGAFLPLSPRQQLTPSPYAIYSINAGTASSASTVVAANVSGTLGLGQLPSAVLTNNGAGVSLSGAFSGNGGGLTNLNSANLAGTIADSRLSANVALLNGNQTFAGANVFAGTNQGLIVNGGPIGTNLFTGLGVQYNAASGEAAIISSLNDNRSFLTFYTKQGAGVPPAQQMKIDRNGVVMIDDQGNNNGVLNDNTTNGAGLTFGGNSGEGIASRRTSGINQLGLDFYTGHNQRMSILNNGNVGIGTNNPGTALEVNGMATVTAIIITGGSDLAEPFSISPTGQPVAEGSVVVIDAANPGQLKLTDRPYDTRVAGVVSGANGIHPGIQMHQQGLLEGGRNVALTGRVYVQADASNGPITPGDLLTTSSTPGRAMKVTDHAKATGAILGKAMSSLSEGQGMVLVLVTLQ